MFQYDPRILPPNSFDLENDGFTILNGDNCIAFHDTIGTHTVDAHLQLHEINPVDDSTTQGFIVIVVLYMRKLYLIYFIKSSKFFFLNPYRLFWCVIDFSLYHHDLTSVNENEDHNSNTSCFIVF